MEPFSVVLYSPEDSGYQLKRLVYLPSTCWTNTVLILQCHVAADFILHNACDLLCIDASSVRENLQLNYSGFVCVVIYSACLCVSRRVFFVHSSVHELPGLYVSACMRICS